MTGSCARFDPREKVEKGAERLGPDRENAVSAISFLQSIETVLKVTIISQCERALSYPRLKKKKNIEENN